MKTIFTERFRSAFVVLLTVAVALFAGTAFAGPPDKNPGRPFEQLEAKLDRIESTVDRIGSLIPLPDGSRAVVGRDASDEDRRVLSLAAETLACNHPLGCTCFLDGFQTACSLVFACLDAGLCECVSGCDNVP